MEQHVGDRSTIARQSGVWVDLGVVADAIRRQRAVIIGAMVAGVAAGVVWALTATDWYEVRTVLAPVESDATELAALGQAAGLMNLIGLQAPAGQVRRKDEALATLRSREFLYTFIEKRDLVGVFFGDVESGRNWMPPYRPRTRADAYEILLSDVIAVSEDRRTGLVTLRVSWTDPEVAAQWAQELVSLLNRALQERAKVRAESGMRFLQSELARTDSVEIRQAIFRLIESQLKTMMLANVSESYAFWAVDPPLPPEQHEIVSLSKPARVALGGLAGLTGAVALVVLMTIGRATRRTT